MKPEPLAFPRGVRFPRIDEIPGGAPSDAAARIAEAERTPVTTGYVQIDRADAQGYTTVLEANVHSPDLWSVFSDLVEALLPLVHEAQPYGGTESGWCSVVDELREKFRTLPEPPSDAQAV